MIVINQSHRSSIKRYMIWLISVSFVLFQFFLQLSSGVVIGAIMHDHHLSALMAGLLSSSFYIVYTCLQIPTGLLFDRKSTPWLLAISALVCSLGCFIFASSDSLPYLFIGRLLMGSGSAFAFVGLAHVLRQQFPLTQFAFMIGVSETLGFVATVVGIMALGAVITQWGWRGFINSAGCTGLVIAGLSLKYIPNSKTDSPHREHYLKQLTHILTNTTAWINGLFVGLNFTVVTAFGALWAVPFVQTKLHCELRLASAISAVFFLGTALSCPLLGWLSGQFKKRKPLIISSSLCTILFFVATLYWPTTNIVVIMILMFMIGTCCGAYMLAYTIANELAPAESLSTCTGFTNTLAVITTPLLQPLIGYLLDLLNPSGHYTLSDYQYALLTIPASITLATALVFFLPEKKTNDSARLDCYNEINN